MSPCLTFAGARRLLRPTRITALGETCKLSWTSLALIPLLLSFFQAARVSADDGGSAKSPLKNCTTSLPLSPSIAGVIAADWRCEGSFQWAVQAGAVGFAWKKWQPFATGGLAVGYPPWHSNPAAADQPSAAVWQVAGQVSYVFLPDGAFANLDNIASTSSLSTPALQQWSLLADADVSLTLRLNSETRNSTIHSYSLKLWQTLPSQWRTLGALRDTRDAELQGLIFQAHWRKNSWSGTLGAGRMAIALDKISLSFFYPKAELTYHLQSSSNPL
ncbi:MAG: hypothetical protein RL189_1366 [Pseudomonadota bacterium]